MSGTPCSRRPSHTITEAAAQAKAIAAGGQWTAADIDALNLVPDAYRGLDRYETRKRVVADIDADGDLDLICGEFLDSFTWFENVGNRETPKFAEGRKLISKGEVIKMDLEMMLFQYFQNSNYQFLYLLIQIHLHKKDRID